MQKIKDLLFVCSNFRENRKCGNFTRQNFSKVRAARAARLCFIIRPMKFLICGVVNAIVVVDAEALKLVT